MQVAQARIPRPEIVEGDPDPEFLEAAQCIVHAGDVAQEGGLGDLDLEPVRREPGLGESLADGARNVRAIELPRRDVDRDVDVGRPVPASATRLFQDQLAHLHDGAGLLGDLDELTGGHQAAFRMVPAQQGLAGDDPSGAQVDDRLEMCVELIATDRVPEVDFSGTATACTRLHILFEETDAPSPGAFRLVERHVGVTQQLIDILPVMRKK